jgi:hypothetical protein
MKTSLTRGFPVMAALVLMSLLTARAQTVERSLAEFLAVQGTYCIADGSGGCLHLQGPQPNPPPR